MNKQWTKPREPEWNTPVEMLPPNTAREGWQPVEHSTNRIVAEAVRVAQTDPYHWLNQVIREARRYGGQVVWCQ